MPRKGEAFAIKNCRLIFKINPALRPYENQLLTITSTKTMENKNCQGRSFKGQDLTHEDFSYADIRGADFSNANLTGANFRNAKAGLPTKWIVRLFILCLIFGAIAGVFAGADAYVPLSYLMLSAKDARTIIPLILIVITQGIFFFTVIRFGFQKALAVVGVMVAIVVIIFVFLSSLATKKFHF